MSITSETYTTLCLAFLPIILIFLLSLLSVAKSRSKLPPGPKRWPIIGHIHLLGNKSHRSLTELSKIHGPLMSLKLGSIPTIVISSSQMAKEMFLKHDLAFSSRQIPDVSWVGNHAKLSIAWLPVCPKWRNLRKIAAIQLFTNKSLDAGQGLRQKKVDELVGFARECCVQGVFMDVGKAAFTTSLNLLSNTFFSLDLCSHDSSESSEFRDIIWQLMELGAKPNVSDFFPMLRPLDLQGLRKKNEVNLEKMMGCFEKLIAERLRESSEPKNDVLGTLLQLVMEKELSLDEVKHMLVELFVAGTDTTSTTLEWAMAELLKHPKMLGQAKIELNKVIGEEGTVHEKDISKLTYIQAIIKETLIMHPPAPFLIPHKVVNDVQLSNYYITKNTQVLVNLWSIGRDSSTWENPESFMPERFIEREIDFINQDFMLIPFGAGRRMCPGMQLGYRMIHLMLATLLHAFNWTLPDGKNPKDVDMEEQVGITMKKVQPLEAMPKLL